MTVIMLHISPMVVARWRLHKWQARQRREKGWSMWDDGIDWKEKVRRMRNRIALKAQGRPKP